MHQPSLRVGTFYPTPANTPFQSQSSAIILGPEGTQHSPMVTTSYTAGGHPANADLYLSPVNGLYPTPAHNPYASSAVTLCNTPAHNAVLDPLVGTLPDYGHTSNHTPAYNAVQCSMWRPLERVVSLLVPRW